MTDMRRQRRCFLRINCRSGAIAARVSGRNPPRPSRTASGRGLAPARGQGAQDAGDVDAHRLVKFLCDGVKDLSQHGGDVLLDHADILGQQRGKRIPVKTAKPHPVHVQRIAAPAHDAGIAVAAQLPSPGPARGAQTTPAIAPASSAAAARQADVGLAKICHRIPTTEARFAAALHEGAKRRLKHAMEQKMPHDPRQAFFDCSLSP